MTRREKALTGVGLGWATLVAQVLLLRELWCATWGSEALAGAAVAVWLLAGGLGSVLGGRARALSLGTRRAYPAALAAFAFALPGAILLLRWLPAHAAGVPGAAPGLARSFLYAVASLGVVGLLSGALFPLALREIFLGDSSGPDAAGPEAASLYRWDMVGSLLAGAALTASVLALGLGSMRAALLDSAVALGLAARHLGRGRRARAAVPGALAGLAALLACVDLDHSTLAWRYAPEAVRRVSETPAGRLVLTERAGQTNAYLSGRFAGSAGASERAEAVAAVAAGECARPERALLLGEALAAAAVHLAAHGARVTAVGPDRSVARALGLGGGAGILLQQGDARAALRGSAECFDLIVIDAGSPGTFAQARLMTRECFGRARARLAPGGVLAVVLPANPAHMSAPERRVAGSVWRALGVSFPRRRLWALSETGLVMVGFASDTPPVPRAEVAARVRVRRVALARLAPERLADPELGRDAEERIRPEIERASGAENRDAHMAALLDQMQADRVRLGRGAGEGFRLPRASLAPVLAGAAGLGLVLLALVQLRPAGLPGVVALAAGLAGAALEVAMLVAYQVARGSLYAELGLVLAAFMAGGALGASLARQRAGRGAVKARACAWPLAALALAAAGAAALTAGGLEGLAAGALLIALVLLAGACVGAAFGLACAHPARPSPGAIYGLDLAGAAAGGLAATFLVPWAGTAAAALAAAILASLVAGAALLAR